MYFRDSVSGFRKNLKKNPLASLESELAVFARYLAYRRPKKRGNISCTPISYEPSSSPLSSVCEPSGKGTPLTV